jgi:hypothetical protein
MRLPRFLSVALSVYIAATLCAQAPTGEIDGTLYDMTGAVLVNATVVLKSESTGYSRTASSNESGRYSFPSLIPGTYELQAQAPGFRTEVTRAVVQTGGITTVDVRLSLGDRQDTITVPGSGPQLQFESHAVEQVVTRDQMEQLPLNGRSFLELAMLEPGVLVSPTGNPGQFNKTFDVSVLGNDPDRTRITVDGARINDPVEGGTEQNFSLEIVQEFQVSSANFDLSTGLGAGGAINIVTRAGSNEFHGAGFFFFRDHHMAAYPFLQRDPANPDPFFARRQTGGSIGGPLVKNRFFFFGSYEHNNQSGGFSTLPSDPIFQNLSTVTASPFHEDLLDARLDYRISGRHTVFVRYSHDANNTFAPAEGNLNSLPSAWVMNQNYSDSGVFSLTSILRPTVINEFRYSMSYWSNQNAPPSAAQCPGCLGLGGPQVTVDGAGLTFGNQMNSPQSRLVRRQLFADNMTTQRSNHRMKFGGEWEYVKGTGTYSLDIPAAMTLFSPEEVRASSPAIAASLPSQFNSLSSVMSLPLMSFDFGIGDTSQPPAFDRGDADHDNLFHVYWQDTWKIRRHFTLNYGLAWSFESNALNHDLTKPQFLAPIFGENGLGPERHAWLHFTPALGFAWSLPDEKTVFRGGGGIYYDTADIESRLLERSFLGPLGTGFLIVPGSILGLDYRVPTAFSGAALVADLPLIRALVTQEAQLNPDNANLSVRNIDLEKAATDLFPRDFVPDSAQHLTLGSQHQFRSDFIVSADLVYKHFLHQMLRGIDLNHFYAVTGPVIPACTSSNAFVPGVECSNGPIEATISGGRSTYKGLLVRAEKRLSHRVQGQVSYALQNMEGIYGMYDLETPIFNLNNWFQNVGPQIPRHVLNVSGIIELPAGIQVSLISSFNSRMPFQPLISGVDFYGSGMPTPEFPLPGSGTNQFNFGLGASDLIQLVNRYNQMYAGKPAPNPAQIFPYITLPQKFSFGRNFDSQDVRVSKRIRIGEHVQWQVFAEIFNILNYSNLSGYDNQLLDPGFGQPTSRVPNIFGTGGARAVQIGSRLQF